MELEELKLKWKVLSERLDREQVIRRQDMERMLRGRVGSYLHYVQLMLLLGVAVVPLCVAIGKFRGVSGIFIWWVVAGYLLCLLPSFFSLTFPVPPPVLLPALTALPFPRTAFQSAGLNGFSYEVLLTPH